MGRTRTLSMVAVAVVAAGAVACAPASERYLSDGEQEVYLRIPRDWNDVPGGEDADPLVAQTGDVTILSKFVVSPDDDAADVTELGFDEPYAAMTVYELGVRLNERMSNTLARIAGSGLGFDPALPDEASENLAEVLDYDPDPGGELPGSRIVYRLRDDPTADWVGTFDLTTYFDPITRRLYVLEVGCSSECFERSADAITRVASSWQIGK